jgi:phage terminase large subunit-like protein
MIIIFHNDVTNKISMFTKFYIPEDMANKRSRSDLINYTEWGRQGHIVLTEGDATDYNVIATDIVQLTNTFDYAPIAYDKALASMFSIQLQNTHNVNVESFSQAVGNVTGPTKQFYEWILNKNLEHDSNPVMAWMMSNIEVYQDDANGNYKIHKGKSKNKVDGPCAAVNAIGRLLSEMKEGMIYTKYVY